MKEVFEKRDRRRAELKAAEQQGSAGIGDIPVPENTVARSPGKKFSGDN